MQFSEEIFFKIILAILIGGLIGAEREYRSKSAGFRTLTMICLGATLFTIFSLSIGGAHGTPDRIASNVVVGIGFVGAGVIFKGDNRVNGITTAALIWVTAALGMGIGAGYATTSIVACILIMIVLYVFSLIEKWIDHISQIRNYKIVCDFKNETLRRFELMFKEYHLDYKRSREMKQGNQITGEWTVKGSEKNHWHFIRTMLNDPTVKEFEF
ncbi:MAG: magnesium transporter MgtC [Bacteroidetes bacterium]|nr:MAG: magnesium transporter MgtC [Bacteroidota bacterium]